MASDNEFDIDDLLDGVDISDDEEGEEEESTISQPSSKLPTETDKREIAGGGISISTPSAPGPGGAQDASSNSKSKPGDSKPTPPVVDPPLVSEFGMSDDKDDPNDLDRKAFSPKKLAVIRELANMGPGDTLKDIATRAGVSERSVYRYLASNRVRAAVREIRDRELASIRIAAGRVLKKKVLEGDMEAMKIWLKMVGDAGIEFSNVKVSSDSAAQTICDVLGLELDELPED